MSAPSRVAGASACLGVAVDLTDLAPVPHDGSHLTAEQVAHIEQYMAQALRALDLAHWRVHVARDLPPEDALLMIDPTAPRRVAHLHVSAGWLDRTAEEKRTDIAHEALHLAHHDTDTHIRDWLDGSGDVADYVKGLVMQQFKTNLERMVDSLSYVVAPLLPEWTDPETADGA